MLKLCVVRKNRGITQEELSRLSGVPQQRISMIEQGKCVVWKGWKMRISQALNWQGDMNELFEEVEI